MRRDDQRASDEGYLERVCLTGATTEVRVSETSDTDMGEAGDGTSDTSMAMVMAMVTAVTPISADTASTATLEPMERNENGKQMRSEAPAADLGPGDWRSRIDRTAQQQAQVLAQLHRTIAKMASILEAHPGGADSTAGSAVARDEDVIGGERGEVGHAPPG
jgi:hypothetical protein